MGEYDEAVEATAHCLAMWGEFDGNVDLRRQIGIHTSDAASASLLYVNVLIVQPPDSRQIKTPAVLTSNHKYFTKNFIHYDG
jgi:hypothetical protein